MWIPRMKYIEYIRNIVYRKKKNIYRMDRSKSLELLEPVKSKNEVYRIYKNIKYIE